MVGGDIGIGVRRLSIIDAAAGHRPFVREDGQIAVVGNGEIYNHADLRRGFPMRGDRFASASDIEVLGLYRLLRQLVRR